MKATNNIFIQVIHKPERRVICKRGVKAEDYFPYCEEVGCDVWGLLLSMDSLLRRAGLPVAAGAVQIAQHFYLCAGRGSGKGLHRPRAGGL